MGGGAQYAFVDGRLYKVILVYLPAISFYKAALFKPFSLYIFLCTIILSSAKASPALWNSLYMAHS